MSAHISHIPFFERLTISNRRLLMAALIYSLPVALLFAWKPLVAVAVGLVPILILVVAHGPSAILLLIFASFVFIPLSGEIALLPADMAAFVLIAAYIIDLLSRGPAPHVNRMTRPYLVYMLVMLISIGLEGFTDLSVRFYLRQIVLFGAFAAVAHFGYKVRVRDFLNALVIAGVANSTFALIEFLQAGGGIRAFGLAGLGFGDHAMLAFLVAAVFYFWSRDVRPRFLYGVAALVNLGGMAATQTRASVVTAMWGLAIIVFVALWAGKKMDNRMPRRNLATAALLVLLVIPLLALYTPVFEGISHRFGRMGLQATGTILLRLSLWKAALAAFWANPVFGIGTGNFANVYYWVPEVRFDTVYYLISGLSTHALTMTALAETGLVGFAALAFFLIRAVRVAFRKFNEAVTEVDIVNTHCLLTIALAVLGSSVYAGSWFWGSNSYHMAIFFGLAASYRLNLNPLLSGGKSV